MGPTDVDLLTSSRAGRGGFEAFYLRHRDSVLAFHAQRVADAEAAADLTAETFAAALQAVHDPKRTLPETPAAWLFTIAHRKLIDGHRRGRVRDDARRRLGMEPIALYDEDIERIHAVQADVDVEATLADHLTADQLQALKARVLDERPYGDIAAQLGCSEAVVRMRVSRALKTLRTAMEVHRD